MIRHRPHWLFVTLLCIAGFFIPFRFGTDAVFYIHLMDAAHLPVFCALTLFAHAYWPWDTTPSPRRRLYAAGGMTLLSALIELIQPLAGRSHSWTDFINGFTGILIALLYLAQSRLLIPLTLASILLAFHPAWKEFAAMHWRATHFPLLADFESDTQLPLWVGSGLGHVPNDQPERTRQHASHGEWSLRVTTPNKGTWPGVRLLNGAQDWRGKTALAFDIWNPGPPFTLSIRIDDDFPHKHHQDRFNSLFPLVPGWNHITIPIIEIETRPKNRRLNLAAIQRTIFFVDKPKAEHTFFIDHIRLD